jgi:hypothetical protein
MLKPPKKKGQLKGKVDYYESHPMERLYAQKKAELEFFENHDEEDLQELHESGCTGISALIEGLQTQYSSYLNRCGGP